MLPVITIMGLVCALYWRWMRVDTRREQASQETVDDLSSMGDVVATGLSPSIDVDRCIGSGACLRACPERTVIGMLGGRAQLVNPLACVGHARCAGACPVQAITLVFGTPTQGIELPRVDQHLETNQSGVYIIGELGGTGLIRNAVAQGRRAARRVVAGDRNAGTPPRRGTNGAHDVLVVGAGPAGIAATLALMQAGLDVQLLEREGFGGAILQYPRAKVVMSGHLHFPLYGKVSKRTMSKEALLSLWQDIRERTRPPVHLGHAVTALSREDDGMWHVHTSRGEFRGANVLLALGNRGTPRKLGIPGEEQAKVAYELREPEDHRDRHVLVVGGGNSAVESVLSLADAGCCRSVTISYRRPSFARCRGQNRERLEALIAAGRVRVLVPTTVVSIAADRATLRDLDSGAESVIANDAVIVQIGGTPPAALLRSFGIEMVTKYGES